MAVGGKITQFLTSAQMPLQMSAQKIVITEVTRRFPSSRKRVPIPATKTPIIIDIRFPFNN
jgi:hypothetical protein